MAEIRIRLIYNLHSGKKDIYIDYESDSDALPIEHEKAHRAIVERLIGQKVLSAGEAGEVIVQRVEANRPASSREAEPPPTEGIRAGE